MATLDTRIPLAVQQPDIVGSIGRGMSLKSLATQGRMQDMQLQQAEQEMQQQRTLNDLYRGNVGPDGKINRQGLLQGAAQQGLGSRIPGLQKGFAEADKLETDAQNTRGQMDEREFGVAKQRLEAVGGGLQSLLSNPNATPDDALSMLQGLVNAGIMSPEEGAKAWREVPTGSPQQFRNFLVQKGLQITDASKRIDLLTPKFEKIDAGNRVVTGTTDQMTGEFTPQGPAITKAPEGFVVQQDGALRADPGFVAARSQIARAGASQVNVNATQEKEESKAVGKFLGEQYADIQKAGIGAQGKLDRASRMEQLLRNINTGKLEGFKKDAAAVGQAFGITIDPRLGEKEAFEALSNQLALEARNPSGGAGMPGAMSDKDREFLQAITPNLAKTPEGNRLIIETTKRLARRDADVARLARAYRQRTGTLDEGFFEELRQYSDGNPLFDGQGTPAAASAPTPAPTVGTTQDGFVFVGGDPASPQSWKKVGK